MYRVIDANINRVCEGLRVLEDITRFELNIPSSSSALKKLRHQIRDISTTYQDSLISHRDSEGDIGPEVSKQLNFQRDSSIKSILYANFKRVQEGLRSLEEATQINIFESARYKAYSIEKSVMVLLGRKTFKLPPLYGITYSRDSRGRTNVAIVKEMIEAGIKLIQYREKDLSVQKMLNECIEIRELTRASGVTFIVNDHIDIAILVDADGVHIGQDDLPLPKVRKLLGPLKFIGLSTHSPDQALEAVKLGADYIGVGPIHATQTKVNVCDPVGYSYLEWVAEHIDIPFVAIGGIKEHNVKEVLDRSAKSVALVSEITGNSDIAGKVKALDKIMKEYTSEL